MYSFWHPKIAESIRKELREIDDCILEAKITANAFGVDTDETRWSARGHLFLNQIVEWDFKEVTKQIETQILSA
jgi:hypothetical protein